MPNATCTLQSSGTRRQRAAGGGRERGQRQLQADEVAWRDEHEAKDEQPAADERDTRATPSPPPSRGATFLLNWSVVGVVVKMIRGKSLTLYTGLC